MKQSETNSDDDSFHINILKIGNEANEYTTEKSKNIVITLLNNFLNCNVLNKEESVQCEDLILFTRWINKNPLPDVYCFYLERYFITCYEMFKKNNSNIPSI